MIGMPGMIKRGCVAGVLVGVLAVASTHRASAAANSGLWVGSVLVDAVSEVNKPASDLSFNLRLLGTLIEDDLVPTGSTWKYDDTGVNHGTAWRDPGFADGGWSMGSGPLGYPTGAGIATVVGFGGNPNSKHPTTYLRKSFSVTSAADYSNLRLRVRRDDGIALYLNGNLILKDNLPSSFHDHDTLAISEITDTDYQELDIPASHLVDGANVIAAEVHQAALDGPDLAFDLGLTGDLANAPVATLISPSAGNWKYYDAGDVLPAPAWQQIAYPEPGWQTGSAQFGFGDGDEATVVASGPSPSDKSEIFYFRKHFTVTDPTDYSHLDISLLRDDGAVVYLNGVEVMRSNLSGGAPIEGVSSSDENRFYEARVDAGDLVAGNNVLAVEVHQHASELTPFEGTAPPSKTATQLDLRLLLHVDTGGAVRLLKEVVQMWQDGTLNPDGTLAVPGHFVLLTDHELIPQYKGIATRDGALVGRRLSSVGFDFPGETATMSGSLTPMGTVTGTIQIPPTHPTHPYRHRYHPDHDSLDATYEVAADEVNTIDRAITLSLSARYPPDPNQPVSSPPPGWGLTSLGGVYTETITGLHRDPIEVKGVFTLNRVSDRDVLNQ